LIPKRGPELRLSYFALVCHLPLIWRNLPSQLRICLRRVEGGGTLGRYIGVVEQWTPPGVAFSLFILFSRRHSFGYDQRGLAVFSMLNWGALVLIIGMTFLAVGVGLHENLNQRLKNTRWNRRTFMGFFKHSVFGLIAFLICSLGLASSQPISVLPFWAACLSFASLSTLRAICAALDMASHSGDANGSGRDVPKGT